MKYSQNKNQFQARPKSSNKQILEMHVACVYAEIAQMLQEVNKKIPQKADLEIELPNEVPTAVQRVDLIKSVFGYLLDQLDSNAQQSSKVSKGQNQGSDEDEDENKLACNDCENYQKNLQKLEGEVRNHIRTYQQLKLYQDGLEDKIEQFKKQKKQMEKKYENVKKKYEQSKNSSSLNTERIQKLQQENQKLRVDITKSKSALKTDEPKKGLSRYESNKENLNEWRNGNFHQRQRNSVQKRPQSTQRMRTSINVRSNKGIPISSKIVQEKSEKARALKHRLGF